jgi:hypothetical protein
LSFFANEIAIKDELSRNTAKSREYHRKFAAGNVCYQLKKVPRFRLCKYIINAFILKKCFRCTGEIVYRVIINDFPIAVGVGDVVKCAASLITSVRVVSSIGGDTGGTENLSASLSNVARLAAHPKFVWVFNASC